MEERDRTYLQLLSLGLIAVRDCASAGDLERCKMEAEHLHNIPSLIGEQNKARHLYFISTEKNRYLGWVLGSRRDLVDYVGMTYLPLWNKIEETLGVGGILKGAKGTKNS